MSSTVAENVKTDTPAPDATPVTPVETTNESTNETHVNGIVIPSFDLTKELTISEKLRAFMGYELGQRASYTQVTDTVAEYIHKNKLETKRGLFSFIGVGETYIKLDNRLGELIGPLKETHNELTWFNIHEYLLTHVSE